VDLTAGIISEDVEETAGVGNVGPLVSRSSGIALIQQRDNCHWPDFRFAVK
jgi:hypothetical protein